MLFWVLLLEGRFQIPRIYRHSVSESAPHISCLWSVHSTSSGRAKPGSRWRLLCRSYKSKGELNAAKGNWIIKSTQHVVLVCRFLLWSWYTPFDTLFCVNIPCQNAYRITVDEVVSKETSIIQRKPSDLFVIYSYVANWYVINGTLMLSDQCYGIWWKS